MYKHSSEEERVKSNETRAILAEEMIFDWNLSVGRIWTCTDGLEGHSGWGTWGVQKYWETYSVRAFQTRFAGAASEDTAGKKEGQIGGIPRMPTAVSTKMPLL